MKNGKPTYFVLLFSVLEILCGAICDHGRITNSPDGGTTWLDNCRYYCEDEDSYHEFSELSWDQMKRVSGHVRVASTAGLCDSLSDLVYSNGTYCHEAYAPRCGCSDTSKDTEYHIEYELFEQKCKGTFCKDKDRYFDELTYYGSSPGSNSNPYHWDDFQCPPAIRCNETVDDQVYRYSAGQGWFKKSGSDCTTFCYCDFDGNTHCEEGYDAIESSKNIDLVDAFRQGCGSSLGTCLEDVSLWTEGLCRRCPQCGCGENAGDYDTYWITEVAQSTEYAFDYMQMIYAQQFQDAHCYNCSCKSMTVTEANLDEKVFDAVSCRSIDTYLYGYGQCPPDTTVSPTKCYSSSDLVFDENNADETECGGGYEGDYCGWTFKIDWEDRSEDDRDRECMNDLMCDAMGVDDGECVYYNLVMDYNELLTGCDDGESYDHIVNTTNYESCCSGDLCNTGEIDITQCTYSEVGEQFMTSFMACQLKASAKIFHCPEETDRKETTCKELVAFGDEFYGCFCEAYSIIYDELSDEENKQYAKDSSAQFWKGLNHWLKGFGCKTKEFGCNFRTGGVTTDGAKSMSVFVTNAVVFTAVLVLHLF